MDASIDTHLLGAEDITRTFKPAEGELEVLKGVNISVQSGEMTAIVGESGVGKSTLLHILGGLDKPSEGFVKVKGTSFNSKNESDLAQFRNTNIGFVFQHHYLMEDFTALENVMIPSLIAGESKETAQKKAEQLLDNVGLKDRMTHFPKKLSGGEQQRVAVARALVNNPGLVIADEPSGNLDINTGEKLHNLLASLNDKNGTTFLIATHNKDLAKKCRRIVKLENGFIRETEGK